MGLGKSIKLQTYVRIYKKVRTKMSASFIGTWKKESSTNVDKLLEAIGHGDKADKATAAVVETTIAVDGDKWTITRQFANRTIARSFVPGSDVEFDTLKDGVTANCTTSFDGTTLAIKGKEKDYSVEFSVEGGKLIQKITAKGVTGVRTSTK